MITFLIGHRGSGKTTLLKRIETYYREAGIECLCLDLDSKIAEVEGKSVEQIFAAQGEAHFRKLEVRMAEALVSKYSSSSLPIFVALGAGFQGTVAKGTDCLWVRRPTDSVGRVFMDRPRLDLNQGAIQEYQSRFKERQSRYRANALDEITIPEGFNQPNEFEKNFFLGTLDAGGAYITVQPEILRNPARWESWITRRLSWNLRFELRDDLLTPETIKMAMSRIPAEKILLSLRAGQKSKNLVPFAPKESSWDWPLEWDMPHRVKPPMISLHERKGKATVLASGERLERASKKSILKLSVEVRDFEELLQGHEWAMKDPEHRAFLPRSMDGRWNWYRLFNKGRSPLNFVREGDGTASDQPYLLDWVRTQTKPETFAAILGDPITHSLTPAEQWEYFAKRSMPVLAIPLDESEWDHGALHVLEKVGLRAAAVTSPLKKKAPKLCPKKSEEAERFASVNTLAYKDGWIGHNTDFSGLRKLLETAEIYPWQPIAVWGGGGTLQIIESLLPLADFYSARTGEHRRNKVPVPPQILIWAVGPSRISSVKQPPADWKPDLVLDLNYGEDSPGREYALKIGAKYTSGLEMFKEQAAGQRAFWDKNG